MRDKIESGITLLLVLAALAVATSSVKAAFFPRDSATLRAPTFVPRWQDAMPLARRLGGDSSAVIKIVTFVDFECPGCAAFHQVLSELLAKRSDIEAMYVHYPLSYHRFALPAARAAECAALEGRFAPWAATVFAQRDSLGLKSWGRLARDAGVVDTARLASCASDSLTFPFVAQGQALGNEMGIDATPAVIVNGWKLPGTPTVAVMDSVLAALADGPPDGRRGWRIW